jgi:hypothetical protein
MTREKGVVNDFYSMADYGHIKRDSDGKMIEFTEIVDVSSVSIQPGTRVSFEFDGRYAVNVWLD